MATKSAKPNSADQNLAANRLASVAVSPRAMLAWGRIPSHNKAEIIAAIGQASPEGDANTRIVKVGPQVLKVRSVSSGFRVIYEPGDDRNTIVSVMTPREARLARG
ncbi:MAG: hypothetical protein V4693_01555 [Pseudomonadota bacterium]